MATDDDPREKYREAQLSQARRARETRMMMTEGQEYVLEHLHPPLYDEKSTFTQVCDYLGITRSTLQALIRLHTDELLAVGYKAGQQHAASRFSRRAVLHLAMLLRPSASDMATRIKKSLGIAPPPPQSQRQRWSGHVTSCKNLVAKALGLAQDIQEVDPTEVWNTLCRMDRWQLQGCVVALGAITPLDDDGLLKYLNEIGATAQSLEADEDGQRPGNAARGLASLIPATRHEYEEDEL